MVGVCHVPPVYHIIGTNQITTEDWMVGVHQIPTEYQMVGANQILSRTKWFVRLETDCISHTIQQWITFVDSLIPAWLYGMADAPVTTPLQLHLKPQTLNWDGNVHENFKTFKICATVLLEESYSRYDPTDKVAALLLRKGDKGFHLYD